LSGLVLDSQLPYGTFLRMAYCVWLTRLNSASVALLNATASAAPGSSVPVSLVQASYDAAGLALAELPTGGGDEESRIVFKWIAVAYADLDVAAALDPGLRTAGAPPVADAASQLRLDLNAAFAELTSPRLSPVPTHCAG
jgi:hypothetical protein